VDEVSRYGGPHIVRLHRNQSRQGSVAHLASAIEAIGNDAFVIMAHGDDVARPDRAGARIGGRGHIGTEVEIGIGTTVIDRITVGARTIVGAGAVVIRDCPADAIMIGVPARAREK
jgi:acetyltransferase-like isoleucine patch superfamily enzyme